MSIGDSDRSSVLAVLAFGFGMIAVAVLFLVMVIVMDET